MIEKNRLSAFFDGEQAHLAAEAEQWVNSLNNDEEVEKWKSYALTRDVLREKNELNLTWDISAQVAKALESEPNHQVQQNIEKSEIAIPLVQLKNQPTAAEAKKTLPAWLQQFAQIGTAAAVSAVVILGVQRYNAHEEGIQASLDQPPVLQTIPLSGEAAPVSLSRSAATTPDEADVIEQRQRINEFFQDFELQRRLNAMDLEKMNEEEPIE